MDIVHNRQEIARQIQSQESLSKIPLFRGIKEEDFAPMLSCLSAVKKVFQKGSFVYLAGEPISLVGVVLEGKAQVVKEDVFGNRTILTDLGVGDIFGETFACVQIQKLPVSVVALTDCEIMFIDYFRIINKCVSDCQFHTQLIQNFLVIFANKNIMLNEKIQIMSRRTTREKLLEYLNIQSQKEGSLSFQIPFNRQALADYLCVERSAMSNELGKLKEEGILDFHKNEFHLLANYEED